MAEFFVQYLTAVKLLGKYSVVGTCFQFRNFVGLVCFLEVGVAFNAKSSVCLFMDFFFFGLILID